MMAVPGSASRQQQVPVLNLTKPIIIDRSALIGHHEVAPNEAYIQSGLEIVPWKPVAQALAIQIFAAFVERWETENQHKSDCVSGPCFEFQAQQTQTILEAALSMGNPTRASKRCLGLPTMASVHNPTSPVVDRKVRRSPHIRAATDGFSYTWLDKNPTKKQKITALQIDPVLGQAGPVAISTLQSWGYSAV
jgi:hypothetical protein